VGTTAESSSLPLSRDQAIDAVNLGLGLYSPASGFMGPDELEAVALTGRLLDGSPIGLPILLNLPMGWGREQERDSLSLQFEGEEVAILHNPSVFDWDASSKVRDFFGTDSPTHPGVARFLNFSQKFISGRVALPEKQTSKLQSSITTPQAIREEIRARGWSTVVGFQTRNVPHRAHEELIRTGLEVYDGVLIQPLVGPRKEGDFSEGAISRAYDFLLNEIFPASRVLFSLLRAHMFYGGPREALLHAVMRRNFGCTHFIVGRDHAGVSDFYGEYAAQDYCADFGDDLGIEVLAWSGPYFCALCDGLVSKRSCRHADEDGSITRISGTKIRAALAEGLPISRQVMRPEIIEAARRGTLFIEGGQY
jgi:sulfate adenylyltransferase